MLIITATAVAVATIVVTATEEAAAVAGSGAHRRMGRRMGQTGDPPSHVGTCGWEGAGGKVEEGYT